MANNPKVDIDPDHPSNLVKDPSDWVTRDEPMTGAQASYLKTLSEEARTPFDRNLSKSEASARIEELQRITGRGLGTTRGRYEQREDLGIREMTGDDDWPEGALRGDEDTIRYARRTPAQSRRLDRTN